MSKLEAVEKIKVGYANGVGERSAVEENGKGDIPFHFRRVVHNVIKSPE